MQWALHIVELLHAVVMDLTFAFFSLMRSIRTLGMLLSSYIRTSIHRVGTTAEHIALPAIPRTPKPLRNYLHYLKAIYNELEEETDKGNIPTFFIVAVICIIIGCSYLFFKIVIFYS